MEQRRNFKKIKKIFDNACTLLKCSYICESFYSTIATRLLESIYELIQRYYMATTKRRLITSIHNLTPEQLAELKALYPLGFNDVMMRYDKPDGTFFYTVPYETEDTYYMVKIDVKIDDAVDDDNDGYYDDDEIKGADELADAQSDDMSDEDY